MLKCRTLCREMEQACSARGNVCRGACSARGNGLFRERERNGQFRPSPCAAKGNILGYHGVVVGAAVALGHKPTRALPIVEQPVRPVVSNERTDGPAVCLPPDAVANLVPMPPFPNVRETGVAPVVFSLPKFRGGR